MAAGSGQSAWGDFPTAAVIVSTYRQPAYLDLCLQALRGQHEQGFDLLVADDGSGAETEAVIARHAPHFEGRLKHIWQEDQGFRKCRILNVAVLATEADYLIFIDGDCLAPPGFVREHLRRARRGHYLNGALVRLTEAQTARVDAQAVTSGIVFDIKRWALAANRRSLRFLKLLLPFVLRDWLNRNTTTTLYWLGSNSSCFRRDLLAVNGFDNRFGYGFEDGDFGNRLQNHGLQAGTVRYTATVVHLEHDRPYRDEAQIMRHREMMVPVQAGGRFRAVDGIEELAPLVASRSAGARPSS